MCPPITLLPCLVVSSCLWSAYPSSALNMPWCMSPWLGSWSLFATHSDPASNYRRSHPRTNGRVQVMRVGQLNAWMGRLLLAASLRRRVDNLSSCSSTEVQRNTLAACWSCGPAPGPWVRATLLRRACSEDFDLDRGLSAHRFVSRCPRVCAGVCCSRSFSLLVTCGGGGAVVF